MNAFVAILVLAVASASASWVGHDVHGWNAAAHIPSGSVSVSHDGAVIAGPSGSVHTDNGLHGHGAGARLSGPAGEVGTHGGHARLAGPGLDHVGHVAHVAPLVHAAPVWGHHAAGHVAVVGPSAGHVSVVGPSAGHVSVVGPTAHASIVAPVAHHAAVIAAPAWGYHGGYHGGVVAHGLVGHGHHGW